MKNIDFDFLVLKDIINIFTRATCTKIGDVVKAYNLIIALFKKMGYD